MIFKKILAGKFKGERLFPPAEAPAIRLAVWQRVKALSSGLTKSLPNGLQSRQLLKLKIEFNSLFFKMLLERHSGPDSDNTQWIICSG